MLLPTVELALNPNQRISKMPQYTEQNEHGSVAVGIEVFVQRLFQEILCFV